MNKVILEAVVGSTVHGTAVDDGLEDLDIMSVVIESQPHFTGFRIVADDMLDALVALDNVDHWIERTKPEGVRSEAGDVDHVTYGLKKYVSLALKSNPSVLLALFVQGAHQRVCTEEGQQLIDLLPKIVSRNAYGPYRGYMRQQYERLMGTRGQKNVTRPELIAKYGYDTKYAGHIARLGLQGEELLRTGRLTLPMVPGDRDFIIAVRTGHYKLAEISDILLSSEQRLMKAHEESTLPDRPDYKAVNDWMVRAYMGHWREEDKI